MYLIYKVTCTVNKKLFNDGSSTALKLCEVLPGYFTRQLESTVETLLQSRRFTRREI
jgi:hypothetical protein